jgi:hypothetical protein
MSEMLALVPLLLWCAWWLWCVNWKKAWPVLAQGGWVPVVLLMVVCALAWSQVSPGPWPLRKDASLVIPHFWWQLGGVTTLTLLALLCGWLQGQLGWTPAEVSFEPPAPTHHAHGHH